MMAAMLGRDSKTDGGSSSEMRGAAFFPLAVRVSFSRLTYAFSRSEDDVTAEGLPSDGPTTGRCGHKKWGGVGHKQG